jgi:Mrp family chromosome partitioning ATPase
MAIVSNTPYFPKKLPIVLIVTLATLLLGIGFITTGELLAGNVYRPGFVAQPGVFVPEAVAVQRPSLTESASARESATEPVPHVPSTQPHMAMPEPQFAAQAPLGYEPAMPMGSEVETNRDVEAVTHGAEAEGGTASPEVSEGLEPALGTAEQTTPSSSAHADAIAGLATALKESTDGARRSVVFCLASDSSAAHTSIALARKLAERGRVALVDLAFGSPSVAAVSSDPAAPGIAELLRGTSSFGDIITRDRASRVHVISAGEAGPAGASLLSSERLAIAMDALGRTYEHLIIDAGVIADMPLRRFSRLAPQAVLVSATATDESVQAAQEMLIEAGFTSVTLFAGVAPEPETMTPVVGAAAA